MPIKGVTSEWLLNKIDNNNKKLTFRSHLVKDIKDASSKIVIMLGAGDIGVMVNEVASQFLKLEENEI